MDFLRAFPFVLGKEQRIQFLAVAYVGDVLNNTYTELFDVVAALSNAQDQSHIDEWRRSQVFRLAWEVVEHADNMNSLICASGDLFVRAPAFSELKTYFKTASSLRNKKVHLFQNLKNITEKKRLNYLHGIVKWTHNVSDDKRSLSFSIKVLTIEPMTHDVLFDIKDGIDSINYPIDNVILEAFESRFNITRFMFGFRKYVAALEGGLEEEAKRLAKREGILRVGELKEAERLPLYGTVRVDINK
jgi:hypothetical protein